MALIKTLDSNFGCQLTYHRITAISLNIVSKIVVITLASYTSKEARRTRCNPIEIVQIHVPSEDYFLFLKGQVLEIAYQWLKDNVLDLENCDDDFETFNIELQRIEIDKEDQ